MNSMNLATLYLLLLELYVEIHERQEGFIYDSGPWKDDGKLLDRISASAYVVKAAMEKAE